LTWLRDHKRMEFEANAKQEDQGDDEPDWILEHARKERLSKALQHRQDFEQRLVRVRDKERRIRRRYDNGEPLFKRQKISLPQVRDENNEDQFVLEEYNSDEDGQNTRNQGILSGYGISTETQTILKRLGMFTGVQTELEEVEMPDELKVFYCSRTHSQLSQFANELRRVQMPAALSNAGDEELGDNQLCDDLKHLTLGSRKNLCINPKVNELGSATAINERCLELQQSKTSAQCRCPYLPKKDNEVLINEFRDHALAEIRDIEDLGQVGKKLEICPYYASRAALRPSEVRSQARSFYIEINCS
jgi:chromosome transmission fidelity protein 1